MTYHFSYNQSFQFCASLLLFTNFVAFGLRLFRKFFVLFTNDESETKKACTIIATIIIAKSPTGLNLLVVCSLLLTVLIAFAFLFLAWHGWHILFVAQVYRAACYARYHVFYLSECFRAWSVAWKQPRANNKTQAALIRDSHIFWVRGKEGWFPKLETLGPLKEIIHLVQHSKSDWFATKIQKYSKFILL